MLRAITYTVKSTLLEESGADDPKRSEIAVNLNSDNVVDPLQSGHSWLRRFLSTTVVLFYSVSVSNFCFGFFL